MLREEADGELKVELREFGGFKRDRREMARWVASFAPESVVMESTGIYWKSPSAALERVGVRALGVNARHVKQVPGRKTDLADADTRLKASEKELLDALGGDLSEEHRLVLGQLLAHIDYIEGQIAELRRALVAGSARLLGRGLSGLITSPLASARVASRARAIPTCGASCARRPTPPTGSAALWPKSPRPCSRAAGANGRSSPWLISC